MFEKINKWYKQGLWTKQIVLNSVNKGVLTEEEAKAILSEKGE